MNPRTVTFRAATSAYVVFSLIFGYVALMSWIAVASNRSMLPVAVTASVVLAAAWAWLSVFRVVVTLQSVRYTTLFRGTVSIDYGDVSSVRTESGVRTYADRFKPFMRLVIEPSAESGRRPICINLKILTKSGLQDLLDLLRSRFVSLGRVDVVEHLS